MNERDFKDIIEYYTETGLYLNSCPEDIKELIKEEAYSLNTLKIKLGTQRYAINNILSIIDRCEEFGIVSEVLDETIQLPNSSIPGSEIDYTHFLEKMIEVIAKNKYNLYINLSNIEGIDMDEIITEFQDEYGEADLNDVCIEEVGDSGCSNTLSCENIRDRL